MGREAGGGNHSGTSETSLSLSAESAMQNRSHPKVVLRSFGSSVPLQLLDENGNDHNDHDGDADEYDDADEEGDVELPPTTKAMPTMARRR